MALRSELFVIEDRGDVSEHGFYEENEEMPMRSKIDELNEKIKNIQEMHYKDQKDYLDTKSCVKVLIEWRNQLPTSLKDSMKVELSEEDPIYQRLENIE